MSDVFISYKAEDRRRIQPLVQALQADGYSVWWDEHIGTGDEWRHTIEKQLDSARCVVVIWSKGSVGPEGHFVRDEAARAQRRHVYVPVLIDAVDPPLGFGESQATSLKGWKGDRSDRRYEAVLAAVKRIAGTASVAATSNASQSISRRAVVAGGAIAAAAVAGVGTWAFLKSGPASASGSVAVLPFANLSGDPNQTYFSDGVAEEIRSALARIAGLKVVGRTSSEAVRNDDSQTAAKKLGVANILTGSVRQSPSTIRVTAELIDGRSGIDRWSQDYDRSPGDAIKIQTDIAEKVAQALSATLGTVARAAITAGGTNNPAAQNLVLQAFQSPHTKEGILRAMGLLDGAIALDPRYADAVARKAILLNVYASNLASGVPELLAYRAKASQTAKRALELAPNFAGAHHAMAFIDQALLELPAASAEFRRALQLGPGDAATIRDYSYLVNRLGRASESLQLIDKAVALDPLNSIAYSTRMSVLFGARMYAEAARFGEDLHRKSPELFDFPELVGISLVYLGRSAEAQRYFDLAPSDSYLRLVGESMALIRAGRPSEVQPKIASMRQLYGDAASYQYGQIYAQLGDKARAFAALDRAWDIRDSGLLNLKVDELMDPLRSDPRFAGLLRKVNFPA
jgi:TolB-like protein